MSGVFQGLSGKARVEEELDAFLQRNEQKSALLFPPLPSRLRFLIHKTAENYPSLSTFSVGEGWSRRLVVCDAHLRLPPEAEDEADRSLCERPQRPGRAEKSRKRENYLPESRRTPNRGTRRPDKAIYVPRAMREKARHGSAQPELDSSGCGLNPGTSKESCLRANHGPSVVANPEPASDGADESAGEQEVSELPDDSSHCDQTVSSLADMSLDNPGEDGGGTAPQPPAEGAADSGDYTQEILASLKEGDVVIENAQGDYSCYESTLVSLEEFTHVIEIFNFPAVLKTEDLTDAFADFSDGGLKIVWVDDTHALGVFSSPSAALQALSIQHPLLKARPLSEGSRSSMVKAQKRAEFIQPVKERPRTDTAVARRMVTRALGLQRPGARGRRY